MQWSLSYFLCVHKSVGSSVIGKHFIHSHSSLSPSEISFLTSHPSTRDSIRGVETADTSSLHSCPFTLISLKCDMRRSTIICTLFLYNENWDEPTELQSLTDGRVSSRVQSHSKGLVPDVLTMWGIAGVNVEQDSSKTHLWQQGELQAHRKYRTKKDKAK